MRSPICLLLLLLPVIGAACDDDAKASDAGGAVDAGEDAAAGVLDGPCRPDATCDPGLLCTYKRRCIVDPTPPAATDAGASD